MYNTLYTYIHIYNDFSSAYSDDETTTFEVCNGYDEQDSFNSKKFYNYTDACEYAEKLSKKYNTADIIDWDN
jgi:hypothetical protein|tara:strand:- start:2659 stop:2874 length:216 start_codon:yes stop_codon:yes gene_type:complete